MNHTQERRTAPLNATMRQRLFFPVLELFFATADKEVVVAGRKNSRRKSNKRMTAPKVAEEIKLRTGIVITREDVYDIVREAKDRGYVQFHPPSDRQLGCLLGQRRNRGEVHVVPTYAAQALKGVASRAADLVLGLILQIAAERGKVHLAVGVGYSTKEMLACLAARLEAMEKRPRIVCHMLAPTLSTLELEPHVGRFRPLVTSMDDLIAFESLPFVDAGEYDRYMSHKPLQNALAMKSEIDIVVTSLASSEDRHGVVRSYLERNDPASINDLRERGWIGDLQLNPYGESTPLQITGGHLRPMTLLGLDEYRRLAHTEGKHVVLLCAPCGRCDVRKTSALVPLLDQPELHVWNHLVVDITTAEEAAA